MRHGNPPRPRAGAMCRCNDNKPALVGGVLCSDHELLWMAKTGKTSHDLMRKDGKRWRQFIRDYRVKIPDFYNRLFEEGVSVGRTITATELQMRAADRAWAKRIF